MTSEGTQYVEFRYKPERHIRAVLLLSLVLIPIWWVLGFLSPFDSPLVIVELSVFIWSDRWWASQRVIVDERGITTRRFTKASQRRLSWEEIQRVGQHGIYTLKSLMFFGDGGRVLGVFMRLKDFDRFIQLVDQYLPPHVERPGSVFANSLDKGIRRADGII